ncbi:hypothetical protein QN354_02185 [Cryobacterium sp. 5I3]|uniref:hypothetical protein n=1 Tax=Cryobacterium sp. 5I3 TaxID=3048592 RepID=UPI002B221A59|nr:hypothetical protein [Cryobacterium sp. 5I3]MEB0200563.1 hypothetical protein [Cryobacterium sp. 5I3]
MTDIYTIVTQVVPVVGWVGATTTVIVTVWKGWPTFRKVVRILGRFVTLTETLATLPDDLAFIKHELDANSGKSVKDIATRTEAAVAVLTEDMAHVKRQNASLKTSLSRTNRTLTEHMKGTQDE